MKHFESIDVFSNLNCITCTVAVDRLSVKRKIFCAFVINFFYTDWYTFCSLNLRKGKHWSAYIFSHKPLELTQYKNDWIAWRNLFVLKLARFFTHCTGEWKSAPISKQTNFSRQSSRSYIVLTLECQEKTAFINTR